MDQPPRVPAPRSSTEPVRYTPTVADVDALIASARRHPLGVEFLLTGELGSVAATFQAHAFTVVAARDRLAAPES